MTFHYSNNSNSSEFADLVIADVKGELNNQPERQQELRSTVNLDQWHDELLSLLRSIDFQLTSHRSNRIIKRNQMLNADNIQGWRKYEEESAKWRIGAVRFKRQIEERLTEVKALRRNLHNTTLRDALAERDNMIELIRVHREQVNAEYDDETSADPDQELWKVLH